MSGPWQNVYESTISALSYMRKKEVSVDVIFKRDNIPRLYAHKLVMSVWSTYFADLAKQSNRHSPIVISFTEDVDVMKAILEHLYSSPGSNPSFASGMPVQKLIQALDVTERLGIKQVHEICLCSLRRKKVNPTNVIAIFDYGLRENMESLVRKCVKVLTEQGVCGDSLDGTVSASTVETLLKMGTIAVESEATLLRLAMSWLSRAENKCYKSEFLSLIDLSSIEWNEYQHVWEKFPDFFSDSELSSILLAVARHDVSLFPDWYKPKVSSRIEKNCDTCLVAHKRLSIPSCNHMNFPRDLSHFVQTFSFEFKNSKARMVSVELGIGPGDIPESEFTMKICRQLFGQWKDYRLDYARHGNKYTVLFQEPLKLKKNDNLSMKFYFSRGLRENEIKYVMPNIIEKEQVNKTLNEGCVKIEINSPKLAFYCGGSGDPKFLVSSFCFTLCESHNTCLVRTPIKPKSQDFKNPEYKSVIQKVEPIDTSIVKVEEMWVE